MGNQRDTVPTVISLDGQPADDRRVAAVYRCKLQLADLTETGDPDIKFCDHCQQKVFKVVDFDGFEKAVAAKGCIWGSAGDRPAAHTDNAEHYLGAAHAIYEQASELHWD